MDKVRRIRKTRPQKKAFIVGIISSILSVAFGVGVLISALNYPKSTSLDNLYENNDFENISRLNDNNYLVSSTHKNEEGKLDDTVIYLYNEDNKLLDKHNVFNEAKEQFGITNFISFNGCYAVEEADSLYVISNDTLLRYKGLTSGELVLTSYSSSFKGRIVNLAGNENNLFVLTQIGSQYRVDYFDINDDDYNLKSSGYIYEVSSRSDKYILSCSKNMFIYSFAAVDDYLYLSTGAYIRRIHKNMLGNNYRNLYEEELNQVVIANPDLTNKEQNELAKSNCLTKYGWLDYDYDVHTVTINRTKGQPNDYAIYILPGVTGVLRYQDKYFFVDNTNALFKYSVEELSDEPMFVNYLEDELHLLENVTIKSNVSKALATNAFGYDGFGTTGIIFHEEGSSLITIFDLEKEEIVYSANVSTRIGKAFYNENKGTLLFVYQDPVNKKSGVNYLSSCVVTTMLSASYIRPLLIIFIILTSLALLIALISWLSYIFRKVMTYVLSTLKGLKKNWLIYVVLFPSIFILMAFCYYPGIAAIFTSLFDYKAGISDVKTWNNFANYQQIFANTESLRHFGNMALFLVVDVFLAILPPLIFAYFLTLMRSKKISGILRTLLFIPGIIPGIASLLIWKIGIYGDYGLINLIVKGFGGEPVMFFMPDDYTNMFWLMLMGFPFVGSYLIFYGAMMNIPSSYYEAAELDGITVWKRFIKIDIPLCLPQIKYILIMTIIGSIQNFSRIYITMGRTNNVISTPIVEMYMLMNGSERNYGLASAYATILFVILFGLTYISLKDRIKQK